MSYMGQGHLVIYNSIKADLTHDSELEDHAHKDGLPHRAVRNGGRATDIPQKNIPSTGETGAAQGADLWPIGPGCLPAGATPNTAFPTLQ